MVVVKAVPILVVDDDQGILDTVSEILSVERYAVRTAANGREALARLDRDGHIKVVLLDMRMPVLDGWGFARALEGRAERPKILVMTAAENAKQWAEEIGADAYLAKPFELEDLLSAVEKLAV